jgi:hypothetical protein
VDFEDDFGIVIEAPDQGIIDFVFDAEVVDDRKGLVETLLARFGKVILDLRRAFRDF